MAGVTFKLASSQNRRKSQIFHTEYSSQVKAEMQCWSKREGSNPVLGMCSEVPAQRYQQCAKYSLSTTVSVRADPWKDVRITTKMLPVHKNEWKIARKKIILRVPQRHTHRHFKTHLKALTVLWQSGLWCSTVLPFWPPLLPMGGWKYSGGEQKRWFLPTPSATLCPALAAPATPAAPACSPQHYPGGNTALSSMVGHANSPQLPNRWAGFTKMESSGVLWGVKLVVGSWCVKG